VFVADSSVWIDYFRGILTREVKVLRDSLHRVDRVLLCGPILQEVLQGIKDDRDFRRERLRLSKVHFLEATFWTFSRAASLYRRMRSRGFTLGPFDAIIAGHCLEYHVPLLTSDRKAFGPLARHAGLRLA
jgi:predicted nucleic acid-binding protein